MGLSKRWKRATVHMEQTATRVQKFFDNLWTSAGLRHKDVFSQTDGMHTPTICG
jgi:hypothetical protein